MLQCAVVLASFFFVRFASGESMDRPSPQKMAGRRQDVGYHSSSTRSNVVKDALPAGLPPPCGGPSR